MLTERRQRHGIHIGYTEPVLFLGADDASGKIPGPSARPMESDKECLQINKGSCEEAFIIISDDVSRGDRYVPAISDESQNYLSFCYDDIKEYNLRME